MALNVGQDFKKRWLNAPDAVRETFLHDLERISDLLLPQTDIQTWLDNDQRAQQVAQLKVEQAYADEKARLIEAARLRKQLALEKSLAEKRALQDAYNQQLLKDEMSRFHQQTEILHALRVDIDYEIHQYSDRYHKNPDFPAINYAAGQFAVSDAQIENELDSIRLRLELEAETQIEEAVQALRDKLTQAAKEEIEYILKNVQLDQPSD